MFQRIGARTRQVKYKYPNMIGKYVHEEEAQIEHEEEEEGQGRGHLSMNHACRGSPQKETQKKQAQT